MNQAYCVTGHVSLVIAAYPVEVNLTDETGAVTLKGFFMPSVSPGDRVIASGCIDKTQNGIRVPRFHQLRTICRDSAADPLPVTAHDVVSGHVNWRLVRIRGRLQSVQPSELAPDWFFITLDSAGIPVLASAPRQDELLYTLSTLLDSTIDIIGVCTPHDGSRRTRIGPILHYRDFNAIRVVVPPPKDPFDAPDIRQTYSLAPSLVSTLGRHVVHGKVLARWNENKALLQANDGSIVKVEFLEPPACRVGDFIEVLGLPESDLHHINLINAIARPDDAFPCSKPTTLDGQKVLNADRSSLRYVTELHGRAIKITGIVRSLPSAMSPNRVFYLDVGNDLLAVNISMTPGVPSTLQVGMKIQLTGIAVMDIENWRPRLAFPQITGFFVVLRNQEDVRILARPSWWTPHKLVALIAALIAILVGILVWNTALRRLSARKGRELFREQLEHVKAALKTEERTRLAVELHDSLAQNLTGVSLEIDTACKLADEDSIAMRTHLGTAARSLKSCRDELRNCLWDLRSRALEAKTMDEAIRKTLAPHLSGTYVAIRFNVPRERISDNTAHAILRIIRELTLNGIRHGKANKVWVAGNIEGENMLFSVRDNGCGFDPEHAPGFVEGHYGLVGIRERIDEFEGDFTLISTPGKGTKATIALHMPQEEADMTATGGI